ncbi:unnamed protein product [Closterium sp. NIES-53]
MELKVYSQLLDWRRCAVAFSVGRLQDWSREVMKVLFPEVKWKGSQRWSERFRKWWNLSMRMKTKARFAALNIVPAVIPAGCTADVQSLDVSVNKSFKASVRQQYQSWFEADGMNILTPAETTPNGGAKWISRAWKAVPADLIKKAFLTCGISNALDGSEDHMVMAHRRSQVSHEVEVDDDIQEDGFRGNNATEPESDVEEVEA